MEDETNDTTSTDTTKTDNTDSDKSGFAAITSQEDLDRIIAERTKRYRDKASKYDELIESQKSDAQKQQELIDALTKENEGFKAEKARVELVKKVAGESGVPENVVSLLRGDDYDTLLDAAKAVGSGKPGSAPVVNSDGNAPSKTGGKEDSLAEFIAGLNQ